MGFDPECVKIALAAAGGDVDKAMRILVEDTRAHHARIQCEWEFQGDAGWVPFDQETDSTLKQAVDGGRSACEVRIAGRSYFMDFDNMLQTNLSTNKARSIRRRQPAVHNGG